MKGSATKEPMNDVLCKYCHGSVKMSNSEWRKRSTTNHKLRLLPRGLLARQEAGEFIHEQLDHCFGFEGDSNFSSARIMLI